MPNLVSSILNDFVTQLSQQAHRLGDRFLFDPDVLHRLGKILSASEKMRVRQMQVRVTLLQRGTFVAPRTTRRRDQITGQNVRQVFRIIPAHDIGNGRIQVVEAHHLACNDMDPGFAADSIE